MSAADNTVEPSPATSDVFVPAPPSAALETHVTHLQTISQLRAARSAWDDLWLRSDVTFPTMRAELLAQWLEHFAPGAEFQALAVEQHGRWVAALPLVRKSIAPWLAAGVMPCNQWSSSGELLLDASADVNPALDALLEAVIELGWPLLCFDEVVSESARWQAFIGRARLKQLKCLLRPRWQVGKINITSDWQSCRARWSRRHRQHMARLARRLALHGEVQLVLHSRPAPGEAASLMRLALEIEHLGWKGAAGGSILHTPGMSEFFIGQAERLARLGHLEIAFLHCAGRPIAFIYGQNAKGVFHSAKIGYDPQFARFSPGQLLRYFLLERFFSEPGRMAVDFLGPMTESHARWRPDAYTVARLVVALRPLGRVALCAYGLWRPVRKQMRNDNLGMTD